ncbi:MAG: carbohydrate kinase family protein [Kineosporiaceae bacterium]
MRIAVTGSIATDHLMTFGGRFSDSLVPDQLQKVALSFLVDDLQIRRGGVGANIAFGLGCLGLSPVLVGAAGEDVEDYRRWLLAHGVDCSGVRISTTRHTARFVVTTDQVQAQIASFYPGAMQEAREIDIAALAAASGGFDLVLVGADDPEAMRRHTRGCRDAGIPFAADPSQQLAWADGELIRDLVEGAAYLFSNDYEAALITRKTGWSAEEVLDRVGTRVVTHGADGVVISRRGEPDVRVGVVPAREVVDPTGVGDAFRAGFLAGLAWNVGLERAAQLGALLATGVLETTGTQEYRIDVEGAVTRLTEAFGEQPAQDLSVHLRALAR